MLYIQLLNYNIDFCINKKEIIMEQIKAVKTCLDILLIKVTVWLWKGNFN